MEQFRIPFNNGRVAVRKNKNKYAVILPIREGKNRINYKERVENDEYGWRYSSEAIELINEYFNVWLAKDGRVGYKSNNDMQITWSDEPLDFDPQNQNLINSRARDIYNIIKELHEVEKTRTSPIDIISLRQAKLCATLKMLGYSSVEDVKKSLDLSNLYFALGNVSKELEEYISLSFIGIKQNFWSGNKYYDDNLPEDISYKDVEKMSKKIKTKIAEQEEFLIDKDESLETTRGLVPEYCQSMDVKVSKEEWEIYSKQVRKTAELLLGINFDLLTPKQSEGIEDLTGLQGSDLQDKISSLIDSGDFNKACDIEDRFIISETDRFCEEFDRMIADDQRVKDSLGFALYPLKEKAVRERSLRQSYNSKYEQFQKIFKNVKQVRFVEGERPDNLKGAEHVD